MPTMQALPTDHPEMKAWDRYKQSERYESTLKYPENTEGNLWGAFDEGWLAAMQTPATPVEYEYLSALIKDAIFSACDSTMFKDGFDESVRLPEMFGKKIEQFAERIATEIHSKLTP